MRTERERPPVSTDKEDERLPKDDRRIDTGEGGRGRRQKSLVFDGAAADYDYAKERAIKSNEASGGGSDI